MLTEGLHWSALAGGLLGGALRWLELGNAGGGWKGIWLGAALAGRQKKHPNLNKSCALPQKR